MNRRGLSLLELLIAIAIVAIAVGAVARTVDSGMRYETRFQNTLEARTARIEFEERVRQLLVSADLRGKDHVFISPIPNMGSGSQPGGSSLGPGADSLVFTTGSLAFPARYDAAKPLDFETLNTRYGPRGGSTEIALSTLPVGDAGNRQGLFYREQRPADAEPSRGGEESLLDGTVRDIRFEFFDGNDWIDSWDSKNTEKDKLPTAVRVRYVLRDDPKIHVMVVRLPFGQTPPATTPQGGNTP